MSGFASSVMLGDLNDFITPSQACVNPIFAAPKETEKTDPSEREKLGLPKIGLQIENDLGDPMATEESFQAPPDLIKTSENQTAKVSLSDCLACSGCVTSAETVLIEQQSTSEFQRSVTSGNYDRVVVTLSGQTRASIAAHFGWESVEEAQNRITAFLREKMNVHYVIDASVAGDVALLETAHEFLHRFRSSTDAQGVRNKPTWQPPPYSVAVSSTESKLDPNNPDAPTIKHQGVEKRSELPMLSSACPGWICYAEKSNPEALPYIATTKSPQQIAGALVKQYVSLLTGTDPRRVYHATIMPCADKKLEASRKDFFNAETETNDIDCVLTSIELAELMETTRTSLVDDAKSSALLFQDPMETDSEGPPTFVQKWDSFMTNMATASTEGGALVGVTSGGDGGGSGGYLEYVFRVAAKQLYNVEVPPGPLPYKMGRNADIRSVELHVGGKPVLKFAAAYGFRNIQSIVRQMKRGKCPYDFVEIMACPGGCLNGGGQVRAASSNNNKESSGDAIETMEKKLGSAAAGRERLAIVSKLFHRRGIRLPDQNPGVQTVYRDWVKGEPYSDSARALLHTRYHAVPKLENGLLEKW